MTSNSVPHFFQLPTAKIVHLLVLVLLVALGSCTSKKTSQDYLVNVYWTSNGGNNLKLISNDEAELPMEEGKKVAIRLLPDEEFQKIYGFGASFTSLPFR